MKKGLRPRDALALRQRLHSNRRPDEEGIKTDDDGSLVWRTAESYDDWKALMRDLAILKIGLRTMFVFPNARPPHDRPLERHWLSYPITKHGTRRWNRNARLPISLRFKVRPDQDDPRGLRGVIFHVPCLPPKEFGPNAHAIEKVWRKPINSSTS